MLTYDELIKDVIAHPKKIDSIKIRYSAKVAKFQIDPDEVDLEKTLPIGMIDVSRFFIINIPNNTTPEQIIKTVDYAVEYVRTELDRFYETTCPRDIHYYHFTVIRKEQG